MPLQNRVDPFGEIHAVRARGMFTGNRGAIHDPGTRTLLGRRWTTKAWIICDCGFEGRKREVFGRNAPSGGPGWTNLFFLDEVTALAAGHRPCFYCRRDKASEFAAAFGQAHGIARVSAGEIDARLHGERLASGGTSATVQPAGLEALPDGTMVAFDTHCHARRDGHWLRWRFEGYGPPGTIPDRPARLLTPPSTVAVLRAGYVPVWHPSAVVPAPA